MRPPLRPSGVPGRDARLFKGTADRPVSREVVRLAARSSSSSSKRPQDRISIVDGGRAEAVANLLGSPLPTESQLDELMEDVAPASS